jgi:predicted Zn-ribbon and HTH transcriptional regulator
MREYDFRSRRQGGGFVSKWVVLCPACGEEFKVDVEEVPERCPHCRHEGSFEIVDEDD